MRVRDHVALSTVACAALASRLRPCELAGLWAGGVLVDADHYMWHAVHTRRLGVRAALHFFNGADVPRPRTSRALHSPAVVLAVLTAALRRPALAPAAAGLAVHVGLDSLYERSMRRARVAALERDGHRCTACGTTSPEVGTHLRHQPWLLPNFAPVNLVSLCRDCHRLAHERAPGVTAWR